MVVLVVGLIGGVTGVLLGRCAFALESSDDLSDWRGSSRTARVWVTVVLAVVSAFTGAVSVLLVPAWEVGIGVWAFAAASPGLAVIDLAARRLPFAASGAVALITVAGLAFAPSRLLTGLLTAGAVAVVLGALSLVTGSGAGLGDVALAGVAALTLAWAGWGLVAVCFVVAMLASALVGLAARVRWGTEALVPFGPFLAIGWWTAIIISIVDLMGKKKALFNCSGGPEISGPPCSATWLVTTVIGPVIRARPLACGQLRRRRLPRFWRKNAVCSACTPGRTAGSPIAVTARSSSRRRMPFSIR